MPRGRSWKEARGKRDSGGFISVPLSMLNSQAYRMAGAHARMLLFDLFAQYRGNNNGDLCAAWKLMKPRGWRARGNARLRAAGIQAVAVEPNCDHGGGPGADLYVGGVPKRAAGTRGCATECLID